MITVKSFLTLRLNNLLERLTLQPVANLTLQTAVLLFEQFRHRGILVLDVFPELKLKEVLQSLSQRSTARFL